MNMGIMEMYNLMESKKGRQNYVTKKVKEDGGVGARICFGSWPGAGDTCTSRGGTGQPGA